jgi:hypothetical protein
MQLLRLYQPVRIISLISLLSKSLFVNATCYVSDGNHANQSVIYTACNQDTPYSMCYRSQATSDGSTADYTCLPSGLSVNNRYGHDQYWRQGCTDPTWQSDYCLKSVSTCQNVTISPWKKCPKYRQGGDTG